MGPVVEIGATKAVHHRADVTTRALPLALQQWQQLLGQRERRKVVDAAKLSSVAIDRAGELGRHDAGVVISTSGVSSTERSRSRRGRPRPDWPGRDPPDRSGRRAGSAQQLLAEGLGAWDRLRQARISRRSGVARARAVSSPMPLVAPVSRTVKSGHAIPPGSDWCTFLMVTDRWRGVQHPAGMPVRVAKESARNHHPARAALVVEATSTELPFGDLVGFRVGGQAGPDLHQNAHRTAADFEDLGVTALTLAPIAIGRMKASSSMATVTTRPLARLAAVISAARSICDTSQPAEMSPWALCQRGRATVLSASSPPGCGGSSSSVIGGRTVIVVGRGRSGGIIGIPGCVGDNCNRDGFATVFGP